MEAESPLSVFESATVVRLRPGDVVLFRCPTWLSADGREHIVAMLNEVFPAHESVILEGGQDIAVLRPEPGIVGRMWRRVFSRQEAPEYLGHVPPRPLPKAAPRG